MFDGDSAAWYRATHADVCQDVRRATVKQRYWAGLSGWIQGTVAYGVVIVVIAVFAIGALDVSRGGDPKGSLSFLLINAQLAGSIAALAQIH